MLRSHFRYPVDSAAGVIDNSHGVSAVDAPFNGAKGESSPDGSLTESRDRWRLAALSVLCFVQALAPPLRRSGTRGGNTSLANPTFFNNKIVQ